MQSTATLSVSRSPPALVTTRSATPSASLSPAHTGTPSASLAVTTPDTVVAILSLPGCNATALRDDGPTGYTLRSVLADAAGLPLSTAHIVGARCSDDPQGLYYVTFGVLDPVNAYNRSGGSYGHLDATTHGRRLRRRLQPGHASAVADMFVDTNIAAIPPSLGSLGQSSTGLPVEYALTADENVASRVEALSGVLPPSLANVTGADGTPLTVNATAVAAALAEVGAAWAAALGAGGAGAGAAGNVTVVAVAYAPESPTAAVGESPLSSAPLGWIAGPVIGGAALAACFMVVWPGRRRRKKRDDEQ